MTQVVLFKRDLRLRDHRALTAACRSGDPVLCLYVFEPELWEQPDADSRHLHFIVDSLRELQDNLKKIGGRLVVRVGDVVQILQQIHQQQRIQTLQSHEETGTLWTFQRDKAVARWCRQHDVRWVQHTQNGVIRRLQNRDGWAAKWERRMKERLLPAPKVIRSAAEVRTEEFPTAESLGLENFTEPRCLQVGGETAAHGMLQSFLKSRGNNYHREMSSPVTAWDSCSRLSTHLAWGTISLPHVHQAVQREIRNWQIRRSCDSAERNQRLTALKAFDERLHWRCHFMQKLEDQPDIENVNMHRACDELRPVIADDRLFEAWKQGQTGYPLVDACLRAVRQTGWLNFRMRAMVVSFASYHLWLDWRPTSRWLARMFTDYEPGIHYSQFQMQSGTTGISTVRIYNPIKQVADHDPEGTFIRTWVPELADVPTEFVAEPHRMPSDLQQQINLTIGVDYPAPIVDHDKAAEIASKRMRSVRGNEAARSEAREVFVRHGSRRGPRRSWRR